MQFGWGRVFPFTFLAQYPSKSGNYIRPTIPSQTFACFGVREATTSTSARLDGKMMMTTADSTANGRGENKTLVDGSKTPVSTTSATTTKTSRPVSKEQPMNRSLNLATGVTFHVVGDAYVDFFSFLDGDWPESGGDSRLGEPVKCYAGGSSVNTATHLKALITNFTAEPNPEVILHTVLNPGDQYGQMLLDHATKHKIPIDNLKREDDSSTTGHCIAIVSGGERSFMTHQGVVENFTADDLDVEGMASTPTHLHLHLAGFYNIPGFWNGKLRRKLEEIRTQREERFPDKNTTISLVTQHDATKEWDGGLSELFPLLDFVLMNDLEARSIIRSGRRRTSQQITSGQHNGISPENKVFEHEHLEWADYFGSLHPTSKAIVTRGEKGSVALRGKKILSKQKPIVMNSIDPTGAGDSFTAGFLFGLWSWKLGGLDILLPAVAATSYTNATEAKSRHTQQSGGEEEDDAWPIEAIEEGMRWGVSLASAAVMIRGASVPPERSEIQKFLEQAKEPEYPPSSKTTVAGRVAAPSIS